MSSSEVKAQQRTRIISEFQASEPIYRQLPVRVPRGGKLTAFSARCGTCDSEIEKENFRGSVGVPFSDGPALLFAHGYCPMCNTYTPISHRVRGRDGKLTTEYQNENGEWVWTVWASEGHDRLRVRIKDWLAKLHSGRMIASK